MGLSLRFYTLRIIADTDIRREVFMNGMWFRLQQIDLELWKIVIIEIR